MRYGTIRLATALALAAVPAMADTTTRVRGTLTATTAALVHVRPNQGGDDAIAVSPSTRITLVTPSSLAAIKPGSFIGTATRTLDDGSLVAVEVHVFPESMRGAGEGHRPFDLGPKSTMTNGTVGQEVVGKAGQTLTVDYKGGTKQITVPPDVPVVTFAPGTPAALVNGAHVIVSAQTAADGTMTAATLLVGQDGLVPPM